jgi:N6-L-threonylcarbamoyladenine synthase
VKILAIETSCDETAIALLEIEGPKEKPVIKILGNNLYSQVHLHQEFGGVYPNLAKREHIKNLPILLEKTLKDAQFDLENPDIDYIAVTRGPGLEPALWTGITFAQELSRKWNKPVIPTNHMEGHIFSVLYDLKEEENLEFPALALLVSGGHTELVMVNDFGKYSIIGRTRDDAVGEAFDKVARMLSLPYPGGPEISKLAQAHRESGMRLSIEFPRPMIHSGNLDFSFSGLKTAVLYKLKSLEEKDSSEIARAFEDAAIGILVEKTRSALEEHPEIKTLIVAGGVSANKYLQSEIKNLIKEFPEVKLEIPSLHLSTDNALMIGAAAYVRADELATSDIDSIVARGNLSLGE